MRIELPVNAERFGSNLFYAVQKVFELDGGIDTDDAFSNPFHVVRKISGEELFAIERDMAVIIPIKDERLRLLEGVLCGIPHACFPIILSNSQREPIDRYRMEQAMVDNFCRFAKKKYAMFHQRSADLAEVFSKGGYHDLLGDDGLVRNGKAEGMIAAIVLARLLGKKYIGFIDADNFFPGSVLEYVRLFSAGFSQSKTEYSMVRVQWHSKPKIIDSELFFARLGRVTRITNQYVNQLLSLHTGFESDIILTGNAGEHAMSMDLALSLDYSSGFSVETNHFVNMLEKFGGVLPTTHPEVMRNGVEVFQMQSRNPHFHEATKGDDHLKEMIEGSLSVLYHSPLCPETLKKEILHELKRHKILSASKKEPTNPRRYPSLSKMNFEKAAKVLDWEKHSNMPIV